jgi:hypothetical protein
LLLGGLLFAVASSQAVAASVCGDNFQHETGQGWGTVAFASLDPNMPIGDVGIYVDDFTQYLPADSYTGKIRVTINSNGTDISKCGWTLSGSKYITDLPSGKLYGNQSFAYHVPYNPAATSLDYQAYRYHTVTLTFDNGFKQDFHIEQAFQDPNPTIPNACDSGKVYRSGLCYTDCKSGYSSDGMTMCYQNCPSDMSSGATTTSCTKKTYTRAAGTVPKVDTKCSGGWSPSSWKCKTTSSCSGDKQNEDGLCYDKPNSGYTCKALTCWQSCPSEMKDFSLTEMQLI